MKKYKIVLFIIAFALIYTPISHANSAGPPSITIISEENPDDLEVFFVINNIEYKAKEVNKIGETYFVHYESLGSAERLSKVIFRSDEKEFEINTIGTRMGYDNLFTLDFENETLKEGKSIKRSIALISSRVILTLIIEGFIFYLFRFRDLRSWIIFFVINLLTQGFLNIQLNSISPVDSGYMIIVNLLILEFFILTTELVFFAIAIKEKRILHTLLFVLTANISSLFIGLILLPMLPI
jgi:hypothetical protein